MENQGLKLRNILNKLEVVGVLGGYIRDTEIKNILTNITYTGNLLIQKEYMRVSIYGKIRK